MYLSFGHPDSVLTAQSVSDKKHASLRSGFKTGFRENYLVVFFVEVQVSFSGLAENLFKVVFGKLFNGVDVRHGAEFDPSVGGDYTGRM